MFTVIPNGFSVIMSPPNRHSERSEESEKDVSLPLNMTNHEFRGFTIFIYTEQK